MKRQTQNQTTTNPQLLSGCLVEEFELCCLNVFDIYIYMKKCVKIYVSIFKMLKMLLKMPYQTGPKFLTFHSKLI